MSAEAADLISHVESKTASQPLGGNTKERIDELLASADRLAAQHVLTLHEATHLIQNYGAQAPHVLAALPDTAPAGLTRLECAQIAFAVNHEMAQSPADVLLVSTYWGYERKWTRENLAPFEQEIARLLGRAEPRTDF
jgi:glycerol-3-phosphate dehydrogenase